MNWDLVIDLGLMALLGVVIFYAARLSLFLKTFHDGKKDMGFLVQDLSSSVARAENAINAMQDSASQSGQKLQDVINEAKFISDELRFMIGSGNSLADRLEKLAERNSELVEQVEGTGGVRHPLSDVKNLPEALRLHVENDARQPSAQQSKQVPPSEDAFFIRDTEFDSLEMQIFDENEDEDDDAFSFADKISSEQPSLNSQAEQELYQALRRRKRRSAAHSPSPTQAQKQRKILDDVT